MLASTAGRPARVSAGKVMRVPPPARALTRPAAIEAAATRASAASDGSMRRSPCHIARGVGLLTHLCGRTLTQRGHLTYTRGARGGSGKAREHGEETVMAFGFRWSDELEPFSAGADEELAAEIDVVERVRGRYPAGTRLNFGAP